MSHFGEELKRIFGSRGISNADASRASGLSTATIGRAIASPTCNLSKNSVIMLLEALSKARPPLTTAEAVWFADQVNLDRRAALTYVHDTEPLSDGDAMAMILSELTSVIGTSSAKNILSAVLDAVKSTQAPSKARTLVIKHAPVQRPGYVEQTEVEYTPREEPPPGSPGATAAGF